MTPVRTVIACMTLSLILSGLVSGLSQLHRPPGMVHMDMKGTLAAFEADIAKHALTPTQQKTQARRFSDALETTLATYSRENNVVIIVSPALVAGAPDITRTIQQLTITAMTNKNN